MAPEIHGLMKDAQDVDYVPSLIPPGPEQDEMTSFVTLPGNMERGQFPGNVAAFSCTRDSRPGGQILQR